MSRPEYERPKSEIARIRSRAEANRWKSKDMVEENLPKLKSMVEDILQEANQELCEGKGEITGWFSFTETLKDPDGDPYEIRGSQINLKVDELGGAACLFIYDDQKDAVYFSLLRRPTFRQVSRRVVEREYAPSVVFNGDLEDFGSELRNAVAEDIILLNKKRFR